MSDYSFTDSPPRATPAVPHSSSPDSNQSSDIQQIEVTEVYYPSSSATSTPAGSASIGPQPSSAQQQNSGISSNDDDGKTQGENENPEKDRIDSSRSDRSPELWWGGGAESNGARRDLAHQTGVSACDSGGHSLSTSTKEKKGTQSQEKEEGDTGGAAQPDRMVVAVPDGSPAQKRGAEGTARVDRMPVAGRGGVQD